MGALTKTYIRDGRAPIPERDIVSKTMSSIKSKNTKPELILRRALWNNGIKGYRLHWSKAPGRPDIAFPGQKIAIFVNGCFWHSCPDCKPSLPKTHSLFWKNKFEKNKERDGRKNHELEITNWKTITIFECQVNKNLNNCIKIIKELLISH